MSAVTESTIESAALGWLESARWWPDGFQSAECRDYDRPTPEMDLYSRFAVDRLTEALDDSAVVLIHGPRQSGKTTLVQRVCGRDMRT